MEVSYLKKRKALSDPKEEESDGEIEEGRDEKSRIDESDEEDVLKAPEWDVDSFDGLEYYSSDEEEALHNYNIFKRQLIETKVHHFWFECEFISSNKSPLDREAIRGMTMREYWEEMVHVCLQKYNQDKECNVEFIEVVRGNYCGGARSKSYITFMAREKPDGPLVEYQAKAMVTLDGKRHPILCRPAPTP